MTYQYHNLPWARVFQRSCGGRVRRLFGYRVRCELGRGHEGIPHAAERGMEWVRWDDDGNAWLTTPGEIQQGRVTTADTEEKP